MLSWQRRARLVVAIFGIGVAGAVYFGIRERETPLRPAPVKRLDPKALLETTAGLLKQVSGIDENFQIRFKQSVTQQDGSTKQIDVEITVRNRGGRDFVVTAHEAQAGRNQRDLELAGDVKVRASDGFELRTDRATYNQDQNVARAAGAITFSKGRMSGSGTNATYDQRNDVLHITEQSKVLTTDESGKAILDFSAGVTTLDRMQNVLTLEQQVHVLREEQTIDSSRATARLSEKGDVVTYLELRENARVTGGASIESMSARDIDLDYSEDGKTLERVVLDGTAVVAMTGQDGTAGRHVAGDRLELQLAADGAVTSVMGREHVRLDLPKAADAPARTITARTLDATGASGEGLTDAKFSDDVEYREDPGSGGVPRVLRSRTLTTSLARDEVSNAVFNGRVRFEEKGLRATGAEARYEPDKGTLVLNGNDAGGGPHVEDADIAIDARTIAVTLENRRMSAKGEVKTTLRAQRAEGGEGARDKTDSGEKRLPGLLRQEQPANVNAGALEYDGSGRTAVYSGEATLWQGETTIRGDVIRLDQKAGDLVTTGSARSRLVLDTDSLEGRAHEIRYDDSLRTVTYSAAPLPPRSGVATAADGANGGVQARGRGAAAPVPDAQLAGPQGDLRAERLEVVLAREANHADRLEAYTNVTMKVDTRTATGARLTYHTKDERYELSAAGALPVVVVDTRAGAACRETKGDTLIFFKSTDRIIVDGNERSRTQTTSGGVCTQPLSR